METEITLTVDHILHLCSRGHEVHISDMGEVRIIPPTKPPVLWTKCPLATAHPRAHSLIQEWAAVDWLALTDNEIARRKNVSVRVVREWRRCFTDES